MNAALPEHADRLAGCLLGTAVGDALGLPRENLSPRRAALLFPGPVRHGLLPAVRSVGGSCWRGMVSDDTEHTVLTALALIEEPDDPARFAHALARRLKWWLAGGPCGLGKATLTACLRLCVGVSPDRSGVNSAGNGPVMRAAILGAFFPGSENGEPDRRRAFVEVSARLTHTDPRAVAGAQIIAHAAALASRPNSLNDPAATLALLITETNEPELRTVLEQAAAALKRGDDGPALAAALDWPRGGPSGFVLHTVPAILWAWLAGATAHSNGLPARRASVGRASGDTSQPPSAAPRADACASGWYEPSQEMRDGIERALRLGGDADSTAAVVGALAGCAGGTAALPAEWLAGLLEWPRGERWMRRCADRLADAPTESAVDRAAALRSLRVSPGAVPARNAAFLALVLGHALRRLAPPW
ncbi:ADP-ribosylglycohydrolase family protein [Alienimonas chondri]|uniref:ADP-ribosylglycohydrolase n=1 Tax=Alienimonas chondri TaxID=2681879 RepID=A0ABX1VM11_9PLAN|nr:ADP-ribosylglycohydrolase family protein [Alienimonas chondri]NNJ27586.1 hypothetical protein [Alienimonas chondri]